jgi:exosortase E/protease (VPEID-CTERM system)
LGRLLTDRSPGTFRFALVEFLVVLGILTLIFGETRARDLRPECSRLAQRGTAWWFVVFHVGATSLFSLLTAAILGEPMSRGWDIIAISGWLVCGTAAVAFLSLAIMPLEFWGLLERSFREILAFSSIVAAAAFGLSRLTLDLWRPLSRAVTAVVYLFLHPFIPTLTSDAASLTIGTPGFSVIIGPLCSGYEGLGLMLVFIGSCLWFFRAEWRFPRAFILLPVGLVLVWFLNCVRVAALLAIGITGQPDIALDGFHSKAGWLAFNAVALGICLVARRTSWLLKESVGQGVASSRSFNPAVPYLLPFLALLAGSLLAQMAAAGFEWFYGIRVLLSGVALWYCLPSYRALDWRVDWKAGAMGVGAYAVWVGLDMITRGSPAGMPVALKAVPAVWAASWIGFRVLGSLLAAPIAEELAFRGFLLRRFDGEDFESVSSRDVSLLATVISSLAFGVLHGDRWLAGSIAGLLYTAAYIRRGSIGDAVAAHATTNLLLTAQVLVLGAWQLW